MSYIPRTNLNFMSMKNKQYKIDKGLMLFTQPRSPFFYGKIRLNRKYVTKSFAPITDLDEAKAMLFDWQKELLSKNTLSVSAVSSSDNFKSRSEYVEHVPIENDFQFLDSQNVTIELKFKTNDNLGNIITNRSLNTNQPPWYALSLGSSINNYQQWYTKNGVCSPVHITDTSKWGNCWKILKVNIQSYKFLNQKGCV